MPIATTMSASSLPQSEIDAYRQWIQSQGYGYGDAGVPQWNFANGDFAEWLNSPTGGAAEWSGTGGPAATLLGTGIAGGLTPQQIADVIGWSGGGTGVQNFMDTFSPEQLNRMTVTGAQAAGWLSPDEYRNFLVDNTSPFEGVDGSDVGNGTAWSGGSNGGLTYTGNTDGGLSYDIGGNAWPGNGATTTNNGGNNGTGPGGGMGNSRRGMHGPASGIPGAGATGWTANPYVTQMGNALSDQFTNTLTEQWLPAIQDSSIAAGGFGGSRQGVAEGLAVGRAGEGLANALSNLYGGLYESGENRNLQQYGIDTNAALGWGGLQNQANSIANQYSLGQGQLALGNQNSLMNWDLSNQGMDLNRIGLGSQLLNQSYMLPWLGMNNFGNLLGGAAGNNSTTANNSNSGGGWQGLIGGALAGGQLANNFGWW